YEDTGMFTYTSTTETDLNMAGFLLSCGASLNTIVSLVVKEIKSEHVTWLNQLLTEMRSHPVNGVDVYISTISSPAYVSDLASIVQKIMRMENLDIFFAVVLMGTKINIIARNRIPEVDVGRILSEFGGGGHAYAGSAKVENLTLTQVEHLLLDHLKAQLGKVQIARALMTAPAITVEPSLSCERAGRLMTRYNISTLLVVNPESNEYLGYITRQVVEKTLYHQLKGQAVEEYMNPEPTFVTPDADISEIDQYLIEEKLRIIPVIEEGWIKGVITRTDLLNYLVQKNKAIKQSDAAEASQQNTKTRDVRHLMDQRLDYHVLALLENVGRAGAEMGIQTYAVGGFVRDLMLKRMIDDIDIVVEGDGIAFAKYFAKKMGCRANPHKKFGTAVVVFPDGFKMDVASARLEYYTTPAALPIVEQSSLKMDLARRDFTINTLALSLNPGNFGTLVDHFGAIRDLKDKTIRILHNLSFVEDPTRVFRAIKFSNRFGFKIGKVTANLIRNALKIDCFKYLSGLRVLSELKQIFQEENPIPAIRILEKYGLEKIIHPELTITPETYELLESVNKTLAWHDLLYVEDEYPRWAVYFMALFSRSPHEVAKKICTRLKMSPAETQILMEKRYKAENRLKLIEKTFPLSRQELYWGLINFKTEGILHMMALAKDEEIQKAISQFYTQDRHVTPLLQGRDLIQIGIRPGPVFSSLLNEIRNRKLDNKLNDRDEEMAFAVEYAREHDLIP
ncbi:MAG: CBS domain-containing protein, partial [Desulfobacterales bacterium]|nr:CBS domain-containing protein [Desulfobacterales bacterium]